MREINKLGEVDEGLKIWLQHNNRVTRKIWKKKNERERMKKKKEERKRVMLIHIKIMKIGHKSTIQRERQVEERKNIKKNYRLFKTRKLRTE